MTTKAAALGLPVVPPLAPMLARLTRELPADEGRYLYEPKWDGFRCLAFRDRDVVDLRSRNQRPLSRYFPEVVEALLALDADRVVLDGELVVLGHSGFDFEALMSRLHPAASRVERLRRETPACFIAFDLIAVGDADLSERPFEERRARLEEVLEDSPDHLVPTAATDDAAYARVRAVITLLGAEVIALPPERHDEFVAVVSHVPHLAAASLMRIADERADEHAALLRLAAGGFRDMTRIASGHPGIWPDICVENRAAIVDVLDRLRASLATVRELVSGADRQALLRWLEAARAARTSLPVRAARPENLVEVRVPVLDRPGVLAEVTTLAGELSVNIEDLEIAHSAEGDRGVLVLLIDAVHADLLRGALFARGFRPSVHPLA